MTGQKWNCPTCGSEVRGWLIGRTCNACELEGICKMLVARAEKAESLCGDLRRERDDQCDANAVLREANKNLLAEMRAAKEAAEVVETRPGFGAEQQRRQVVSEAIKVKDAARVVASAMQSAACSLRLATDYLEEIPGEYLPPLGALGVAWRATGALEHLAMASMKLATCQTLMVFLREEARRGQEGN